MEQNLSLYLGIAAILAVFAAAIVGAFTVGHNRAAAVAAKTIQDAMANPLYMQLAKGATENIPQDTFRKIIDALQAGQSFAQDAQLKAFLAVMGNWVKSIDHDPTNDPTGKVPIPGEDPAAPAAPPAAPVDQPFSAEQLRLVQSLLGGEAKTGNG
jgi:hypothetical protein